MTDYKTMDIVIGEFIFANPIIDPLAHTIEEEHLQYFYETLIEQGVSEVEANVIDSNHYIEFWQNLYENFDEFFLDNGIALNTYSCMTEYGLSPEESSMVSCRFANIMLEKVKLEIQQRIDFNVIEMS